MLNKLAMKKSLPKIILLSETHLNASKMRHLNIVNYKTLSCNRTMKKGGGVSILIHKSLSYFECKDLNVLYQDSFECIFVELRQKGIKSIVVGSLYRPPNSNPKKL